MKKLTKMVMTTAIIMAMSSTTIIASAQIIDLDAPIATTQQYQQELERQKQEYNKNQDLIVIANQAAKDTLLLETQVNKMYLDTLVRVNYYTSMSSQEESDIKQYLNQINAANETVQSNKTLFESKFNELTKNKEENVGVFEEISTIQKSQNETLMNIKNILQDMNNYLTDIENQ